MKVYDVMIEGACPMLHNRFASEEHGIGVSKAKKKIYVAEEEAEKAEYRLKDRTIFQPSEHIFAAMTKAAVSFKFEGKKTFKDVVKSSIAVEPDCIPLLDKQGNPRTEWDEIDERAVVIQRSRVLKWRPKFNEWKLKFKLQILDDDIIDKNTVKEILEKAGTVGIGDYRPRYGRFIVTEFKDE